MTGQEVAKHAALTFVLFAAGFAAIALAAWLLVGAA